MDKDANDSFPRTPVALGVLTAIVYVAGFATVAAWFALLVLDHPGGATAPSRDVRLTPSVAAPCGICGVVQAVREVEPAAGLQLEGSRAEGTAFLLAALGNAPAVDRRTRKVYETAVLQDDGFLRVLRDTRAPEWQRGDRVKVIMGRVEPDNATPSADAPDAAPAGRTPSPVPPVARVP